MIRNVTDSLSADAQLDAMITVTPLARTILAAHVSLICRRVNTRRWSALASEQRGVVRCSAHLVRGCWSRPAQPDGTVWSRHGRARAGTCFQVATSFVRALWTIESFADRLLSSPWTSVV